MMSPPFWTGKVGSIRLEQSEENGKEYLSGQLGKRRLRSGKSSSAPDSATLSDALLRMLLFASTTSNCPNSCRMERLIR